MNILSSHASPQILIELCPYTTEIDMKGTMFIFGELCLIYKACEIASEFEIEVGTPLDSRYEQWNFESNQS
jgi:hypothetical protein